MQQPEAAGGGNDPSDAVRSITEEPAAAESEPSPSAFSLPEFPAELLPSLLKADTTSRASNADILSFFSKTPLLIDRLRYIRESYKAVFTELLLEDDTRVGFYKESNGLLVWQGSYLTRSAESHLSWHSVTAAISALVDNHELIAAIDPKKAVSQDEQLSFDLPENASRGDEVGALEVDDIYSEEEQDEKIKAALPTYHYKEPQPDDGSHITEDDVNVIITRGSVFEGGKYRIYNHFQQKKTEKETVAFLKKEYGIGGFSWTFADGGSGFVSFDGKGFSILYDFKDDLRYEKKLKWKEVGKRLEYLVRMDRYLTDAGNAVSARYTKTITLPNGASGFQGWYKDGEDTYGNVEWASLLYRMDWEELYGIVDGIKCRATGSGMTEEELRQLFASLNIDATTARGQVVAFALSCQGKFVYAQPSSLRGGPGSPSVGINLDCSSFVQYCYWAQNLPFSAGSTAAYRNAADLVSISPSEVQPGDLRVVYASGGEQGHVQMALGGGAWIECCYGYGVAVNMSNAWMESRPCYYFRYAGF